MIRGGGRPPLPPHAHAYGQGHAVVACFENVPTGSMLRRFEHIPANHAVLRESLSTITRDYLLHLRPY